MFNMTGSEVMFLLIIGLVVLGPEKLPDAIRRVGRLYAELKRMSSGVQTDFRKVMEEPLKEMMNTTNTVKALFTDTANEFQSAAKELVEPTFIPYETKEVPKVNSATDSIPQDVIATKTAEDIEIEAEIARAAKIAQDKKDEEPINSDFLGDDDDDDGNDDSNDDSNDEDNDVDGDDEAKQELSPTLDQVT